MKKSYWGLGKFYLNSNIYSNKDYIIFIKKLFLFYGNIFNIRKMLLIFLVFNNEKDIKNSSISNNKIYIENKVNIIINNNTIKNNTIYINDYEINNLKYEDALIIDKRNFFQYYFSLLKMNHILVFTFYTKNDYNSRKIKIILFLFSFSLYFTINTLFINDPSLHKKYEDEGKFNFVYQLPTILYSTLISSLINIIIKYLSLTEKDLLNLKKGNETDNIVEQKTKLLS